MRSIMVKEGVTSDTLSLPHQRYIEVIDGLVRESGVARITDVAERLDVRLPSASQVVKRLVDNGLAARNERLEVELTPKGRTIAEHLHRRHQALKRFMVDVMAMDARRADELACRVEHCVDGQFAERLVDLSEFLEKEYPWTIKGIAEHVRGKSMAGTESIKADVMI